MKNFKEIGLNKNLLNILNEMGFSESSEIQEKVIPLALAGKDIIGKSATGSGKTLAFGAPIIEKVWTGNGLQVLVLTPTRELAEQVSMSLKTFSKYNPLKITSVYGGISIIPQIRSLRHADIVVGTPGRILDHISRGTIDLSRIKFLVLDEADRMLDMGFLYDVKKIIEKCPKKRQTFLFSATISDEIIKISKKYMENPIEISVDSYIDPSKLKQVFYDVPSKEKFSLLVYLLKKENSKLVMVFCNTKRNADVIEKNLKEYGFDALALHGDLSQNQRNNVLEKFHKSEKFILVCTDVAARGLDIKNVSHVYNYESPKTSIEYIHRIGRTARAGKDGKAITILTDRDYENFRRVLMDESIKVEKMDLPEFEKVFVKMSERNNDRGRFDSFSHRRPQNMGNFRGRSEPERNWRGGRTSSNRNYKNDNRENRTSRRFSNSRSSGHRNDERGHSGRSMRRDNRFSGGRNFR